MTLLIYNTLRYQFADVTTACYNFWLHNLCDYYLELVKPVANPPRTTSSTHRQSEWPCLTCPIA